MPRRIAHLWPVAALAALAPISQASAAPTATPTIAAPQSPLDPARDQFLADAGCTEACTDPALQPIRVSLTGGRIVETLDNITVFRESGVRMPLPLLLLEARLAAMGKDYARSIAALDQYLARPDAAHDKRHAEAVSLSETTRTAQAAYLSKRAADRLARARADCAAALSSKGMAKTPGTIFRDCPDAPEMVVIPGGAFEMGPAVPGRPEDASSTPRHRVSIRSIAVARFELTFDEWDNCVEGGGCNDYRPADRWGRRKQPVINVNWDDAQSYVTWLNAVTGKHYRLLSEAEWEYAARGGRTTDYATGETISKADANFENPDGTVPVGRYRPNGFGLYDMHGNVWEWTQDCWNANYEGAPNDGSAWQTGDCRLRVFRGACWYNLPPHLRANFRFGSRTGSRNPITGIRIARELD